MILNIIINTVTELDIKMATPRYTDDIIKYINKNYPYITNDTIILGLKEYWLT